MVGAATMRRTLLSFIVAVSGVLAFCLPAFAFTTVSPTSDTLSPFTYSVSGLDQEDSFGAGYLCLKISNNNQTRGSLSAGDVLCNAVTHGGGILASGSASCTMTAPVSATFDRGTAWISDQLDCLNIIGGGGVGNTGGFSFAILAPPAGPITSLISATSGPAMLGSVAHSLWDNFYTSFPLLVGVVVLIVLVLAGTAWLFAFAVGIGRGLRR